MSDQLASACLVLALLSAAAPAGAQESRKTVAVYKGGMDAGDKEAAFVSAVKDASTDLYNSLDLELPQLELSAAFPRDPFEDLRGDPSLLEITYGEVDGGNLRAKTAIFGLSREVRFRVKYSKENQELAVATQTLTMLRSLAAAFAAQLQSAQFAEEERARMAAMSRSVRSEGVTYAKIVYRELGTNLGASKFKGLRSVVCHFVPPLSDRDAVRFADDELGKLINLCASAGG